MGKELNMSERYIAGAIAAIIALVLCVLIVVGK
jgi:hypothetical protein